MPRSRLGAAPFAPGSLAGTTAGRQWPGKREDLNMGLLLGLTGLLLSQNLEEVLALHKNSREKIISLHCQIQLETEVKRQNTSIPKTDQAIAEYWIAHGNQKDRIEEGDNISEGVWAGKTRIWRNRKKNASFDSFVNKNAFSAQANSRTHPFLVAQFLIVPPEAMEGIPLEIFLSENKENLAIKKAKEGEDECVLVSLTFQGKKNLDLPRTSWELEYCLKPKYNYLITKITAQTKTNAWFGGETYKRIQTVSDFKEIAPGTFFPTAMEGIGYVNGVAEEKWKATIHLRGVNKPFGADLFKFKYPQNGTMLDGITKTNYKLDSTGNPLQKGGRIEWKSRADDDPDKQEQEKMPTTAEPMGALIPYYWLFGGVTFIGSSVLLIRRMKSNRKG